MKLIEEALSAVRNAEQAVADLVRQAVEQREYGSAISLTSIADGLRNIAECVEPPPGVTAPDLASRGFGEIPIKGQDSKDHIHPQPTRGRPKKGEFPKFLRDEGALFKLGRSKSEKAIYEHKAPQSVIAALVKKLATIGAHRRRFTVEDVLPLSGPGDEAEIPTYQVYLCLAWLRTVDILIQHGRRGYSIAHPSRFESDVQDKWEQVRLRQDSQL